MPRKSHRLIIAVVFAALALMGCSTPAVTGIKVHMQNGEYQDAIHLADSVIAAGETLNAELWMWRGKAQGNIRDWMGASESFQRVNELDATMSGELSDYWFVFYNAAAVSVEDGDIIAARGYLETGKIVVPGRPEYDMMLGDLAMQSEDYEAALQHFETSSVIGRELIASLDEMLASAPADQKPAIEENRADAVSAFILSLYNSGMLHKALAISAESEESTNAHLQSAIDGLSEAVEYDPTNADVLNLLAQIYLLRGSFDEAMEVFEDALAGLETGLAEGWLTPEDAQGIRGEIMLTRGVALLEMEKYPEAVTELNNAREVVGSNYVLLGNLAQAYIMMEDYESALVILDEAGMLSDLSLEEHANTLYMKFAALNQLERDTEAAATLESALEITPDNADWWEYLASTYSRLNRRNDAIEAMERAQAIRGQ